MATTETSHDAITKEMPSEMLEPGRLDKPQKTIAATPPDGGWRAWLQVAGGFFVFFNIWYVSNEPVEQASEID